MSDPNKQIIKLKHKTKPYPKALKKDTIISYFMFETYFPLVFIKDNLDKNDISYIAARCFRTVSCLNQVLFAINEEYCINEKKAVQIIGNFTCKPQSYKKKINRLFTLISTDQNYMLQAVETLQELVSETERLIKSA